MIQKKQRTILFPFLIFLITALFLFSTIIPHISYSQDESDTITLTTGNIIQLTHITLDTPIQELHTNTDFSVNITVQPGQDIAGVQCTLHYNPSLITVTDVTEGNLFTGYNSYFMPGENDPLTGTLTGLAGVITTPAGCINHTGVLATLHLKTLATPGTSPLTLTDIILGGPTAESLPFTAANTSITITPEEESTLLSISPGTQTLSPAKTHTFTIMVSPATEIAGVQTQLTYDPSYIQILSISPGDLFGSTAYFHTPQIDNSNGTIRSISSVTTSPGGTTLSGTLAHITFTTLQKGSTTIQFKNTLIGDPNGTALPAITQPGTIIITASDSTHLSVTPAHQDITQGSTVTINIHVDPQEYIAGIQLDLTYDPTLLAAQTVTRGNLFGMDSYFSQGTIDHTQGIIQGVAGTVLGSSNGTIKPGVFAIVTFTAKETTGQSPIGLTHIILGDSEAQPLFFTNTNASITVSLQHTSISITPKEKFVSPNDIFTIDLQVDPMEAISGVETDISFNPDLITAVSVQEGDLFNGYNTYFQNGTIDNTNGTIRGIWGVIAAIGGGSITTPGTFARITFTTTGASQGTTPLTISHALMGTPGGTPVTINIYNGTVTIGTAYTLTFSLKAGWNTISIPFQGILTAETLGRSIGVSDAIAKWDPESQDYLIHPVGLTGEDFTIEPGQGCIVHVYEDTQFSTTGILIETLALPIKTGWNLVGWIQDTDTTAEQFGETILGCDTVAIWNPETQDYTIHPQGTPIDNFVIHQGAALFIHTTQNSTWYGQ